MGTALAAMLGNVAVARLLRMQGVLMAAGPAGAVVLALIGLGLTAFNVDAGALMGILGSIFLTIWLAIALIAGEKMG